MPSRVSPSLLRVIVLDDSGFQDVASAVTELQPVVPTSFRYATRTDISLTAQNFVPQQRHHTRTVNGESCWLLLHNYLYLWRVNAFLPFSQ